MKITANRRISFFEVNENLELRPRSLVNLMQEAATLHSRAAGYETPVLMKKGRAWILYRIAVIIDRIPMFGDELEIVTWHRGSRKFRSYRDFQFICNGEKLVSATSLWLFIDTERKKILKPPEDAAESYTVEPEEATGIDIDRWRPENRFEPDASVTVGTRPSDYDPLGHVNNALYLEYLETLTQRVFNSPCRMSQIFIQYSKEIPGDVLSVEAGLKNQGDWYIFNISSEAGENAAGKFK